jgi:hypothetical protein
VGWDEWETLIGSPSEQKRTPGKKSNGGKFGKTIYEFDRPAFPKRLETPFTRGISGPGGVSEDMEGRKRTRRSDAAHAAAAAAASGSSSTAVTGSVTAAQGQGYQYYSVAAGGTGGVVAGQGAKTAAATAGGKKVIDRSVLTAAGGVKNVLYSEKLTPEVGESSLFVRISLWLIKDSSESV